VKMMKSYITVLDGALTHSFCVGMIEKFEKNEEHEQEDTDWGNRHFKEINITSHTNWEKENDTMVRSVNQLWRAYAQEHKILLDSQWPKTFGFEQFRMKRYLPNNKDEFSFHTDVGSYASSRRFLSFLWYLNTVDRGGMTNFGYEPACPQPFASVPAVEGRVLMFPPLWTYPHWGEKPISGPKYIVSGYLHYL